MPHVLGIDHVAFAAHDLEATCAFCDRLFGARTHLDYAPHGKSLVRQIALAALCGRPRKWQALFALPELVPQRHG
jgi:catechol 2,3-dioxygenase-like lactoylglutathione lyase family enzyme